MAEITTTERLPFPLAKPNNDTFVTKTSEIGHKGESLERNIDNASNRTDALLQNTGIVFVLQSDLSVNQTVECSLQGGQRINISFNAAYGCGIDLLDSEGTRVDRCIVAQGNTSYINSFVLSGDVATIKCVYGAVTDANIYIADIPIPTRIEDLNTSLQEVSEDLINLTSEISWKDDYYIISNGTESSASTYSIATLYISGGEKFIFTQYLRDYAAIVFTDGENVLEAHTLQGNYGSVVAYEAPNGASIVKVSVIKADKENFVFKKRNLSQAITRAQKIKKTVDALEDITEQLEDDVETLNSYFETQEFPQMLNSEAFLTNYRLAGNYNSNIEDVVAESGWTTLNPIYLADGASRTLAVNMNTNFYMYMYVKNGDNYLEFSNVNPNGWTEVGDHWEYTIDNANIKAIRCKVVTTDMSDVPKMTMADKWAGSSAEYKPEGQPKLSENVTVGQLDAFTQHIEEEVSGMNNKIKSSQLLDLGTLEDGFVNSSNGNFVSATSYKRTALLRVNAKSISVVVTTNVANIGIAFYDHNFRYVSGSDFSGHSFGDVITLNLSERVCYLGYCAINAQSSKMAIYVNNYGSVLGHCARVSDNPCYYQENDFCKVFKKVLCIGDSLTQGTFEYNEGGTNTEIIIPEYSYPTFLSAISGRSVTNKGDAGKSTKTWWDVHQNDDLSGHDACLIALGTNDAIGSSSAQTTQEERFTYMGNIINKVKEENPHIKIFIATMLNLYGTSNERIVAVNADMRTIAANTEDCYLVDILANGDLIPSDRFSHLTAIGYLKLAHFYFNYISYIIAHNMSDFRLVQFIGTEHSHS